MPPQPYKSLAFTIRPQQGVIKHSKLESLVTGYLSKHSGFCYAEKTGPERHLHGQIFYETRGKTKAELKKILLSYIEKDLKRTLTVSEKCYSTNVKIAYSDNYYLEYVQKDADVDKVYEAMPTTETASYYPSPEEQEIAQTRANATDQKYHSYYEKYVEWSKLRDEPHSLETVAKFLYDAQFIGKTIHIIEDPKKRSQITKCLNEYINPNIDNSIAFMLPKVAQAKLKKIDLISEAEQLIKEYS